MGWLYYGLLLLLENRPVVMTASRRDCLVHDSEALDLAMQVVREQRAEIAALKPNDEEDR